MSFSTLTVLVNTGGATANVIIALPPAAKTDPFGQPGTDPYLSAGSGAQGAPGVAGLVNGIKQNGFWDTPGLNYYPPSAILKITPG